MNNTPFLSLPLKCHVSSKLESMILMVRKTNVKKLAAMLMGLQVTDGFLTMWATNHGFIEANPLVAPIAQTWLFPSWKIGSVLLGMMILFPLARRSPKAVKLGLSFASAFMIAVLTANLFTLALSPHYLELVSR